VETNQSARDSRIGRSLLPAGELTPAQHARIRRHLALIPVYIWLVYSWTHVLVRIPHDEPLRDFLHFYVQGVIARDHDAAALYDMDRMADVAARVAPGGHRALYPPVYGPQVSVIFRPFASLSYTAARNLWIVVSVLVYGLCTYAIWRVCPRLRARGWMVALLLAAAPALHFVVGFVQVSVLGLACVTAGFLALRANRPFLAGLAIGSLAYKPPLALGVGFVLLCDLVVTEVRSLAKPKLAHGTSELLPAKPKLAQGISERRLVAGAIVAAAAQIAAGTLYWGPSILSAYAMALMQIPDVAAGMEPNRFHMHSWRTFFDLLGLPGPVSLGAYLVVSAATLIGAFICWRSRGPLELRYAALVIATILVDPHLYAYDLVLLIPAFLVLWNWILSIPDRPVGEVFRASQEGHESTKARNQDVFRVFVFSWLVPERLRRWSFTNAFVWLIYICYLSPLFVTVADVGRLQLSPLLLGLLGVVILGVLDSYREVDTELVTA